MAVNLLSPKEGEYLLSTTFKKQMDASVFKDSVPFVHFDMHGLYKCDMHANMSLRHVFTIIQRGKDKEAKLATVLDKISKFSRQGRFFESLNNEVARMSAFLCSCS